LVSFSKRNKAIERRDKKTKTIQKTVIVLLVAAMIATAITPLVSAVPVSVTKSPTSTSGSWTNPQNAYTDTDSYPNQYGYCQNHLYSQVYGGYGFTTADIPSASTINSVKVMVIAAKSGNTPTTAINVQVSIDGGSTFLAPISSVIPTNDKHTYIVDVTSFAAWTPSNINNNKIFVKVTSNDASNTVYLYWIPIEVTYNVDVPQNVVPEVPFGTIAALSALVVGMVVYVKRGKIPSLRSY
jgi:hypothetical protein